MTDNKSRGKPAAKYFIDAAELGVSSGDISHDIVIQRFVSFCEAIAIHRIDMPRGTLLLLAPDDSPDLGAIYFYDRTTRKFYDLSFEEGVEFDIGFQEFWELVGEYDLKCLGDDSRPQYLAELLFATLQATPTQEAAYEVAATWSRCLPARRHSDDFDS